MRLPIPSPIESRDGTGNKDGLCRNVLIEQDDALMAVVRPGVELVASSSGNGGGLTDFSGEIFSVFGTSLKVGISATTIATVEAGFFDFAQSTL